MKRKRAMAVAAGLSSVFLVLVLIELVIRATGWGIPSGGETPGWSPAGLPFYECGKSGEGVKLCSTSKYYKGYGNPATFRVPKPDGTVRIFCVGGSTTAGMPFFGPGSFSTFLDNGLNAVSGSTTYEVINAGVKGFSSSDVRLVVDEIAGYGPDFIVIYSGHNDFQAGLPESFGSGRGGLLHWLSLKLKKVRIYKLLANFRKAGEMENRGEEERGPEAIRKIAEAVLERASEEVVDEDYRRSVVYIHGSNLERMIEVSRSKGAGPVLCTLSSNIRDYPPNTPGELDPVPAGCGGVIDRDCRKKLNSDTALGLYIQGCCSIKSGKAEEGRRLLISARDNDPVPFRATTRMNESIRRIAEREDLILTDTDRILTAWAENGLPGDGLFLDHVHPDLGAASMIALSIMDGLLDMDGEDRRKAAMSMELYRSRISPDFMFSSYYTEARFCMTIGRFRRARRHCLKALSIIPDKAAGTELQAILDELAQEEKD